MIPDQDGNTFLHLLCKGTIKDIEYDFAKMACTQFQIRLTRNSEGKNPIQLLKENETKVPRGQPNYKRSLTEFLQSQVQQDPAFEDFDGNSALHLSIIRDDW